MGGAVSVRGVWGHVQNREKVFWIAFIACRINHTITNGTIDD